jgi:hypothetical protein
MKVRIATIALSVCLFAHAAFAQFTTVTGTVIDPHSVPYALGTITPLLIIPSGAGSPTLNGNQYTPPIQPVGLDKNGSFSFNLADNNVLLPAGTKWNFTVCSAAGTVQPAIGTGPQCFMLLSPITITGTTQSISTQLNAVALALTVPIGGGGGVCPGGSANQVQYNGGTNCAGISNVAAGSVLASKGTGTVPSMQTKPYYDVRDFGCAQDGVTDDTVCVTSVLNTIGSNLGTVLFTGPTALESITFPPNVTLQFQQQGALQPISSTTPIGGAGFVDHSTDGSTPGTSNVNVLTSSCSVTLKNTTAGNSILTMENHFFTGANIAFGAVTDTQGGHYTQLAQQGFNFSSVNSGWARSNITGGTITVTIPYVNSIGSPTNVANGCIAWEISGMGPVVAAEANTTCTENAGSPSTTMSCTSITTTAGSLVIGWGGQSYLNQASCTPAAGFTQPAGSAGFISGGSQPSTGYGFNLCATYKLVSPGGAQTPAQTITADPLNVPLNKYWSYAAASVVPSSSVINIQGPIWAAAEQIFKNALPGQGTIDFTGNTLLPEVYAEWWGAAYTASPTVNAPALQAGLTAAFGSNRVNGSQANVYNRKFELLGLYNINGTLNANHMNGFVWECQQRFACGFNETGTNTSILTTTTGGTYGVFKDILFTTSASQDHAHPLVKLDYTGVGGVDLINQFIDFQRVVFNGNKLAAIGLQGAKSGGGAQWSNIYHYDNIFPNFTEAAYMIGDGSNCVPTTLATNALAINIFGGDFQGNNAYAIEWFGAGAIKVDGTSFEDGFSAASNFGTQTGADICGQIGAAGDIFEIDNVRTESKVLFAGNGPYAVRNSHMIDQGFVLNPGSTPLVNTDIQGSLAAGHGVYYLTTHTGTWTGIGTIAAPIIASSGTSTTLTNTNQSITGTNPTGLFVVGETVTQSTTGSTGTLLNVPISVGTVTGSVTSGSIVSGHTVTQASTGVVCTVAQPGPLGSGNLLVQSCNGSPDSSHIYTDGGTGGTYTPTSTPTFALASPAMVITVATGSPDSSHTWTGGTSGAILNPTSAPTNVANYTVNAWIGSYLTLLGAGTGGNTYCIITANTANSFTCAAGFLSDFVNVPIAVPDNTSTYIVEPQWGVQTSNGGVTWTPDPAAYSGLEIADGVFIAGLKVSLASAFPIIRGLQVTRFDWLGNAGVVDNTVVGSGIDSVQSGVTGGGVGSAGISQCCIRAYKFARNGITETPYASQKLYGTSPIHWQAGGTGGGISTVDLYLVPDPNTGTKNGRFKFENNSSGTPFYWYLNADGTATFPGVLNGTDFNGTIGATTPKAGTFTTAIATSVSSTTYATATNCAQSGTAANPSVVSCGSAASGAFACNVAASAGTCVVNTTAVGSNSRIIVEETTTENTSLGVTCNTSPTVLPAIPTASKSPGVSFTINMPTITTNPACFDYWIVNQ